MTNEVFLKTIINSVIFIYLILFHAQIAPSLANGSLKGGFCVLLMWFHLFWKTSLFLPWHKNGVPDLPVNFLPWTWNQALFQRVLVSLSGKWCLETRIWMLFVPITTELSLLLRLFKDRAMKYVFFIYFKEKINSYWYFLLKWKIMIFSLNFFDFILLF